ncbi:hypothetical protein [Shouchella patagoniensis]|nr:hypothetical protein [Shouchella patagoniensis]
MTLDALTVDMLEKALEEAKAQDLADDLIAILRNELSKRNILPSKM